MSDRVGFIGLGNMGEGMAYNLSTKGFSPLVFDRRQEPLIALAAEGARIADTCAQVGRESDVVLIAVFDDKQIEQVVFGDGSDEGILAGMTNGGVIVLHPTTSARMIRKVHAAAAEKGVSVIDAPMTGGAHIAARAGTLTLMIGGDAAVVERVRPILDAMATSVFHVGELGSGAATKIINNFLACSQTMLVREALRLARSAGITEENILDMLNRGGVASSWQTINWEKIKSQEATYTTGRQGMVDMATKDMTLAQNLARDNGVATPCLDGIVANGLPDIAISGLSDNGLDD